MRPRALPCFLAALLLAPSARAQLGPEEFATVDSNHDGRAASGEYERYARTLFDQMDGDPDDDRLTRAEVRASSVMFYAHIYAGANMLGGAELTEPEKFGRLDVNQDGAISQTEFINGANAKFQQLDLNDDGELNPDEFAG